MSTTQPLRSWASLALLIATGAGAALFIERLVLHSHASDSDDKHGGNEHAQGEHSEALGHDGEQGPDEHEAHGGIDRIKLTPEGRANAGIEVSPAGPGKVNVTLSLPGDVRVNAESLAHVSPRVGGIAREVKARLGDQVLRGDVLALLDSRELTSISRDARAAQERVKLAEANFTRLEKLFKDGIASEKDFLAAKGNLAEAKIEKESTAEALASKGTGGGGVYKLVAPLDGTIIEKHIAIGEVLSDVTPAFVIADLSSLWVDLTVYSKDLGWIAVGQPVRLRTEGIKESAAGTIALLSATASGEARTTNARVLLERPSPAWKPGLFVTADVAIEEIDAAVVVPEEAIQTVEGRTVVFVEEEDAFESRPVKLGHIGLQPDGKTKSVEILSGLAAGVPIVVRGAFTLKAELGKGAAGHDH